MDELAEKWTIVDKYSKNSAYITVKGAIINSQTHNRAPFSFKCLIDTGFTIGGLYYEETLRSDAKIVGVTPTIATIRLADGSPVSAYVCMAHIEKINNIELPPPGIKVQLFMRGSGRGFIGMEALGSWIFLLDGPNKTFKIKI